MPSSSSPEYNTESHHRSTCRGLLRIGLFLCIGVGTAYLLNGLIGKTLEQVRSGEIGVWNDIVRGEIAANILISGSSRGLVHFDPRAFEQELGRRTYNISLNASRTDLQLARLKTYLAHNDKPELLIQSLDTHSLALTREIYEPGQFMPYLKQTALYEGLLTIDPAVWGWKYIPLYGYAVEDLRYTWVYGAIEVLGFTTPVSRINGFEPRSRAWGSEFDSFRQANPNGVSIDFEPKGINIMKDLIALCKAEEIHLVLVYSPEYFEAIPLATNREEIFDAFEAISAQYGVPFLDYSDSELGKRTGNFYNSQHMNALGAEAFSRDLATKLRRIKTASFN